MDTHTPTGTRRGSWLILYMNSAVLVTMEILYTGRLLRYHDPSTILITQPTPPDIPGLLRLAIKDLTWSETWVEPLFPSTPSHQTVLYLLQSVLSRSI